MCQYINCECNVNRIHFRFVCEYLNVFPVSNGSKIDFKLRISISDVADRLSEWMRQKANFTTDNAALEEDLALLQETIPVSS